MQARLHRPQRHFQQVRDGLVTQFLEVGEEENFPLMVRQLINRLLDPLVELPLVHRFRGRGHVDLHEINERSPVVPSDPGRKPQRGSPGAFSMLIPPLVGSDGEEPGLEGAAHIKGVQRLMDLQKRLLEDILRGLAIAHETNQEPEQGVMVALHHRSEGADIAILICRQQFNVCAVVDEAIGGLFLGSGDLTFSIRLRERAVLLPTPGVGLPPGRQGLASIFAAWGVCLFPDNTRQRASGSGFGVKPLIRIHIRPIGPPMDRT